MDGPVHYHVGVRTAKGEAEEHFTHKKPKAKTPETKNFFFVVICNFQIDDRGSIRTAKSDITLNTPVALSIASML